MANIIDVLKNMPDYIGANGNTEEEIEQAERELGISFAKDYRSYLEEIGLACYDGHELTGLTKSSRLDVVSVTRDQRKQVGDLTLMWYVVEEAGIDDIVIWQSSDGTIYQTEPGTKTKKIAESLSEYIAG